MPRRDPQPGGVVQRADRGRAKQLRCSSRARRRARSRDRGDLLAAEDADDVIDLGHFVQQQLPLPLGKAAGDDHAADSALPFSSSISRMTPSDSCRAGSMNPQVLTMTTSAPSGSGVRA